MSAELQFPESIPPMRPRTSSARRQGYPQLLRAWERSRDSLVPGWAAANCSPLPCASPVTNYLAQDFPRHHVTTIAVCGFSDQSAQNNKNTVPQLVSLVFVAWHKDVSHHILWGLVGVCMDMFEGPRFPLIPSMWRKLLWLNKLTKTWIVGSLTQWQKYSPAFSSVLSSAVFPCTICYSFSYLKLSQWGLV